MIRGCRNQGIEDVDVYFADMFLALLFGAHCWSCALVSLPYREALVVRNWGNLVTKSQEETEALSPATYEDLKSANNYMSEHGNGSSPAGPWLFVALGDTSNTAFWKSQGLRNQLSWARIIGVNHCAQL
jgi:hypothetical protein